jgi:hypothetical protein
MGSILLKNGLQSEKESTSVVLGQFKAHAIELFKSVLHLEVKASLKTSPPIPTWAAAKAAEAWNIH